MRPDLFKTTALAAMLLATGSVASGAVSPPHTDYRPGYTAACGGANSAACHSVAKKKFLPYSLTMAAAPNERDYTNFCLSCHNAAGEAHEKPAGSVSTNAYINLTGFNTYSSYRGDSHSWSGFNGNAGTRTPTSAGFKKTVDGTDFMPGGKVRCQTCHESMGKETAVEENINWIQATDSGDHINYTILGYTSTEQYLSHYINVYRNIGALSKPANSRTRKQYLVSPSEYTYNHQTATVTFVTAQDADAYIYVDIPQPYFRVSNASNAMCLDCHNDRRDTIVSHPGGASAPGKDHHPVTVSYGNRSGLMDTLKALPSAGTYLEGGQVFCTSCHDPHNAESKDGRLLRKSDASALCADCHDVSFTGYTGKVANHAGAKHAANNRPPTVCLDCHSTHGSEGILLVRKNINGRRVSFRNFSGPDSFGNDTGDSVCEVCHSPSSASPTTVHRSDGTGPGHNVGQNCLKCHKHAIGFKPQGGSSPCYGCHDGNSGPNIKILMGLGTSVSGNGKTSKHTILFDNLTGSTCLVMCHANSHNSGSPNLKTVAELDLCNSAVCHNGGGQTTSRGRSISIGGQFGASMHNFTATMPNESRRFSYRKNCTKCHVPHGSDDYPNIPVSINDRQTNGAGDGLCFGCHDSGRFRGAADIKDLWDADFPANRGHYDYQGGKRMDCTFCHGPHGTSNDKMVNDSLGGPGLLRDSICRACHSGTGGSAYNVMGDEPGSYGPDFSAASVHDFGLSVAMGGHTVDLTCVGCHDPHNTQNARLLQDKIIFSGISAAPIQKVRAYIRPFGPITGYIDGWNSYCVECHTSMAETGGQSPFRRHPAGVSLANYSGDYHVYRERASDTPLLRLESGNVSCITCHYTHGSPQVSLLRFQNATTPLKRMCLKCHDQGRYLGGGAGSHGGFMENEGRCADCHNMHTKVNRVLLQESTESVLCFNCHGGSGLSMYNSWSTYTTVLDAMALRGTSGTFGRYSESRGGTAPSMHDINDEATQAPGGVTTLHRCGTCHDPHGSLNYRVVRTVVNNVTGIRVYARTDAEGRFLSYSTGFVRFCAACHTTYSTTLDENGNWIRHPVGAPLGNYSTERYMYTNNTTYKPKVELEAGDTVSCVTCHFAHGSPEDANLKFPGGKPVNACKTCHNRDSFSAGTPGSHAGFAGNDGTCSDCHSMHMEGNAKLLKAEAETAVCVYCHDKPGVSDANPDQESVSHLDVWKGNGFDVVTSWPGTGGSFGTYDPVNGGNAFSMHPVNSDARVAPGDSATVVHCGTCHDSHGSANFRLLKTKLNGKAGIAVSADVDAQGKTTSYNSGMSGFCSACHKTYIVCGSAAGYTRHPVDVALTAQEMANYAHFRGNKYLPLESGNKVTCTTCHFAHGSPYEKMMRMPGNQMCQVCHAKGLDPVNGYQDVMYTHGGFNGNNGSCSVCHSMHTANHRKLLQEAEETRLCYSCHGPGGSRRGNFPQSQLVWTGDSPSYPTEWDSTGGSFGAFYNSTTGGSIMSHHDINMTDSAAPGGTTTEHRCGTCHNPHGNNNYRLLRDDVNGQGGITVRVDVFGRYSSGMSAFCIACHSVYGDGGSGVDGYRRHPVNRYLTGQEMANLTGSQLEPKVRTESSKVMCLSCHYAHGSPSNAMLRMRSYTSSESEMCQQCHMKGYNSSGQQFRYTHGGFNGNRSNCRVCHTVHSKNNKKLLMEPKESQLCDNCHAGIAKFNEFKSHDPDVMIDGPSRFNVFSSIGNSFGNYSVGGGDVASWHEVDGTHTAPGGKTLELRCGKCHNPHGGDNFTMLRESVEGVENIRVFGRLSSTGPFNSYSSGFAAFCSACHTRLTRCGTGNPWTRHPVDFRLEDGQFYNWSTTTILPRMPLEAGNQVTCITCHNSHGSKDHSLQRLGGNRMCQQCHRR